MLLILLFFAVCIGFMVFCFIRKSTIFSIICGGLWFLFAIYTYPYSTGWDVYRGFALLGTLMAILSWVIPFTWRNMTMEEEPEEEEYVDSIIRQREEYRGKAFRSKRKEDF